MNLNKNIFRAYDIRGIAYEELSQETVVLIGKSLGTKSLESGNDSLVAVSYTHLTLPTKRIV